MGKEAKCVARIDGKKEEGKALLETSELIFRGTECRVKITFAEMKSVAAENGELRIKTKDRAFAFVVGKAAEKWREKILHPKSRAAKLGITAGTRVRCIGEFEAEFLNELSKNKVEIVKSDGSSGTEVTFLTVPDKAALAAVGKNAKKMKGADALWMVYPKGKKEITETDVIAAGRKTGLKDVKVVGFSPSHTALKFVIPVEKR